MIRRFLRLILLTAFVALPAQAQDQQSRYQPGWPCTGTVDPSYIRTAEATGGSVLLFHPTEVGGAAAEMLASMRHEEIVFRAGGQLADGVYDFEVPIDSTIESAYFLASLQCLQLVDITRPSGEALRSDATDVEYHQFEAIRLFVVKAPSPGVWKVRVGGKGFFTLIVKAKTDLRLNSVAFVEGGARLMGGPKIGRPQRLEASVSGVSGDIAFQLIGANAEAIRPIDLSLAEQSDIQRTYAGEIIPPAAEFRLAVTGIDAKGVRFQRVQKQLVIPER